MNCLCLFFGLHFTTESRSRNSHSRVHFVSIDENLNNYLMAVLCRTPHPSIEKFENPGNSMKMSQAPKHLVTFR